MKDVVLSSTNKKLELLLNKIEKSDTIIYSLFDVIKNNILGEEGFLLYSKTRYLYSKWKPIRDEVIEKLKNNEVGQAIFITKNKGAIYVNKLELRADSLNLYAINRATKFKNTAASIHNSRERNFFIINILVICIYSFISFYIARRFYLYNDTINNKNEELKKSNLLLTKAQKIAKMGAWEYDHKNNTLEWSNQTYSIFELDLNKKITYEDFIALIHPEDSKLVYDNFFKSVKSRKSYLLEYRIVTKKNNVVKYILESANNIYKNNEIVNTVGILQDITDVKMIEEEQVNQLKINEKLFNNLEVSIWNEDFSIVYENIQKLKSQGIKNFKEYLDNNPTFIQDMANSIKVLNVNKAALTMFRAPNAEKFISSISKTFGANALDVFKNELLAIWNKETYFREEADFLTLDNQDLKGIVSFSIPQDKIDFNNIPVSILDITNIKEKDKLILLQSRHAAMGEMISMIAHQWRQPITTIAMTANNQILDVELDNVKKEDILSYSNNILDQTKYLSQTIDDFRNFFKLETEIENITIEEIINSTLKLIQSSLDNHSIEVKINIEYTKPLKIKKRELIQVLINILNNSKDAFIFDNINNALVKIDVTEHKKYVNISICDNAHGIKENILQKIFEPYFTTKEMQNGTGLGLYMSKIIIEEHLFGKIHAKNNKENGACFTISLPK